MSPRGRQRRETANARLKSSSRKWYRPEEYPSIKRQGDHRSCNRRRMGEGRIAGLNLVSLDAALGPLGHGYPNLDQSVELDDADFYHFRAREPVFPVLGRGGD